MSLPFSVCTGRGARALGAPNLGDSMQAKWGFDDSDGHDETGRGHDLTPVPAAGPARWGVGQSAAFNGSSLSVAAWAEAHEGNELTVSMWLFLAQDSIGSWRTLLRKGDASEQTPTLQLWPKERRLHARVTTEGGEAEGVDSVAVVPLRRWTHVAFVVQGKLLQLYVNGVFDAQVVTRRQARFNRLPLYLGKDPWHPGTRGFVDDARVWDRALDEEEVRALAQGALGPMGPTDVTLGCLMCKLEEATGSCDAGYHLCSEKELFGGAYTVARAQGWFHLSDKIWAMEHTMRRRGDGWRAARGPHADDESQQQRQQQPGATGSAAGTAASEAEAGANGGESVPQPVNLAEDARLALCCTANNEF